MNIIDAWKAAKTGQRISRKTASYASNWQLGGGLVKGEFKELVEHIGTLNSDWVLGDDWIVEKLHIKKELTFREFYYKYNAESVPMDAKLTIEWDE